VSNGFANDDLEKMWKRSWPIVLTCKKRGNSRKSPPEFEAEATFDHDGKCNSVIKEIRI
jgi:hypothetical protein